MIRMIQSQNADSAKKYFTGALSQGDYYLEEQECNGQFHGVVAKRLDLEGRGVEKKQFDLLCQNINPVTGGPLTLRTRKNRTVGYDINFHCPKSVSILHTLGKDPRILNAFKDSVDETMQDIEADSKTRVRKNGVYDDRVTGSLIWADFIHQTSRPVDGHVPDPHLHCHCYVFNTTWDEVESAYKAGQFRDIKHDMPYYQATFHKRLADKLANLGYPVRSTKASFEIDTVPQEAIDTFSKRTNEIGLAAQKSGITDPKQKDALGAKTRSKKQKQLSMAQLRQQWLEQVKDIVDAKPKSKQSSKKTVQQCIAYALDHCFERDSIISVRKILETAIRHGLDQHEISIQAIQKTLQADKQLVPDPDNRELCTTTEIIKEEDSILELAKAGTGIFLPLDSDCSNQFEGLNEEQSTAIQMIMQSSDRVSIIQGGAGTGKTTLMKQAVKSIERSGKQVFTFAPSSEASKDVLRSEGFKSAETVARLLIDEKIQDQTQDQVIWVDEAGLLSNKDMLRLLEIAETHNARLVLSGDTGQHSSVARGTPLALLESQDSIQVAHVNTIYRQKPDDYRQAVSLISQGRIDQAFDILNEMGAVQECDDQDMLENLVQDYIACLTQGKSALILSPTHALGERINVAVRDALRETGKLKGKDRPYTRLKNRNLTNAQKGNPKEYNQGDIIQCHQNMPGIQKGTKLEVLHTEDQVWLRNSKGHEHCLALNRPDDFDVYQRKDISLAIGDQIRITKNSFDQNGTRLDNGKILQVAGFDKEDNMILKNPKQKKAGEIVLPKDFGNFNHAYYLTSYAAQGKTCDYVFIAQSDTSFTKIDQKQLYVSVSRGREGVAFFTDNKKDAITNTMKVNTLTLE